MPTMSQDYRDAAYPQESVEAFVFLLEIDHADLDEPIRLTSSENDLTFETNVYLAAPFELHPPGEVEDDPRGRLVVPNVDQRIGYAIDQISTPPTVRILQVLESDTSVVFAEFEGLKLQDVRGTAEAFDGRLGWDQMATEPWPLDIVGPDKYRAAFRLL